MDSNAGSELIVGLAWLSAQVAGASAVLMLLFALGARRYFQYQERVHARVIVTWRPLLTRIVIDEGERPALPALRPAHVPYLMEEWNALHDALRGESVNKLNAVAIQLGLDIAARRMIRARGMGRRVLAIRTLGHLRDLSSWKPLQDQLASSNSIVSFYAAAALVQIDAQRAMPGIMLQLAERESWPAEAMARLLVDVNADIARDPVRSLMLSLAPSKVPPLLPWLAHVDAVLGSEVAIELLRRHPDDVDIVAAALSVVLDPGVLPELARWVKSPDADVRQNLATAYGRLGGLEQIGALKQLLCDRVWWVRYRAGHALLKLKGMDRTGLAAVRGSLTDAFALDMLRHVSAEAELP